MSTDQIERHNFPCKLKLANSKTLGEFLPWSFFPLQKIWWHDCRGWSELDSLLTCAHEAPYEPHWHNALLRNMSTPIFSLQSPCFGINFKISYFNGIQILFLSKHLIINWKQSIVYHNACKKKTYSMTNLPEFSTYINGSHQILTKHTEKKK